MKRMILLLILTLTLPAAAGAEMHLNEHSPTEWADRQDILRITQVDTNRSDCLLIQVYGKIMLVDGGLSGTAGHVKNVLQEKGIKHFDWMLNTHPHDDHIGAMTELLRAGWTADVFLSPFPESLNVPQQHGCVSVLKKNGIPYQQIEDGYTIVMGPEDDISVRAELVFHTLASDDINYSSALTLVRYGTSTAMLMADLTIGPQKAYLETLPNEVLQADIIKAPHHGITHFDQSFLDIAQPSLVTIPNTAQNRTEISSQCEADGIPFFYSGKGDIVMETDGADWYVWQLPHAR